MADGFPFEKCLIVLSMCMYNEKRHGKCLIDQWLLLLRYIEGMSPCCHMILLLLEGLGKIRQRPSY